MITSTSSSQVKHVYALLNKARERRISQEYVVEGIRMVSEVPIEDLVRVYVSLHFKGNSADGYDKLLERFRQAGIDPDSYIEVVSDNVYDRMTDTKTPQGVMAIVRMRQYTWEDICKNKPLIIAVENLQDPGNLGTIMRMGEAAGATGVVISSSSVDIYNPKTIRSTMGSLYRVPFIYVDDFVEAIEYMKSKNVTVYAAHLDGVAEYTQENYIDGTCFLIGNEGNGLTQAASAAANRLIRIPMEGQVESLNAAIACTVLSFEAARQRRI